MDGSKLVGMRSDVVIEVPSGGGKSTQQAAAKNNNLEMEYNVLAAARQVESVELNRAAINRNILMPVPSSNMLAVLPSRKAIFVSHLAPIMTPEMIKERVQLGLPGVDLSPDESQGLMTFDGGFGEM
uniref:Uncharacterized protein n=1 Tax=Glossina morsitans morsitans TaxID=37546 RepID=A0A1B0FIK9_GLOMM